MNDGEEGDYRADLHESLRYRLPTVIFYAMTFTAQQAFIKRHSYRWLASFLSLWLAVAYLWIALYYPLMCAPYTSAEVNYTPISYTSVFEHTITPYSVVMSNHAGWPKYITADTSSNVNSNVTWLLDSHDDTTGLALTFINVISLSTLSWLQWVQPLHTMTILHTELYTQIHALPPDQPPRLFCI